MFGFEYFLVFVVFIFCFVDIEGIFEFFFFDEVIDIEMLMKFFIM